MQLFKQLARRWADSQLRDLITQAERELSDTRTKLDAEQRKTRVLEAERDELADVLARNRARVEAEMALETRRKAEHEWHGRHHQGAE